MEEQMICLIIIVIFVQIAGLYALIGLQKERIKQLDSLNERIGWLEEDSEDQQRIISEIRWAIGFDEPEPNEPEPKVQSIIGRLAGLEQTIYNLEAAWNTTIELYERKINNLELRIEAENEPSKKAGD